MIAKAWIKAARPRTLPLAFSSALMGSFAALNTPYFSLKVLLLALATTLFLQILSNFANDYGDSVSGLDYKNRVGPTRAVQSGAISPAAMKKAILITSLASLFWGIGLIHESFKNLIHPSSLLFLFIGLGAIIAAIKYTLGSHPYGYAGLGDLFVFIFFGPVGVAGTFFLHTHRLTPEILAPSLAIGLLSMAVLNVNNMRDIHSDAAAGKMSIPVRLGFSKAKIYHLFLLGAALLALLIYCMLYLNGNTRFLPIVYAFPWFGWHARKVWLNREPALLDSELKKVALGTFLTTLLCGLCIFLS